MCDVPCEFGFIPKKYKNLMLMCLKKPKKILSFKLGCTCIFGGNH